MTSKVTTLVYRVQVAVMTLETPTRVLATLREIDQEPLPMNSYKTNMKFALLIKNLSLTFGMINEK